jgi:hypothetical protein
MSIDALAQLGLRRPNLCEQHHWVGLSMELLQPPLRLVSNGGNEQGRGSFGGIALDDAGTDERWLKQVRVQPCGGIEPRESSRGRQAFEAAIADETPHNRPFLLVLYKRCNSRRSDSLS